MVTSTSNWCVDTRTTDQVCDSLRWFQETIVISDEEIYGSMGNATKVAIVAVGVINLSSGINRSSTLENSLYVLNLE